MFSAVVSKVGAEPGGEVDDWVKKVDDFGKGAKNRALSKF